MRSKANASSPLDPSRSSVDSARDLESGFRVSRTVRTNQEDQIRLTKRLDAEIGSLGSRAIRHGERARHQAYNRDCRVLLGELGSTNRPRTDLGNSREAKADRKFQAGECRPSNVARNARCLEIKRKLLATRCFSLVRPRVPARGGGSGSLNAT